jgi:hypothetical protein
MVITCTPQIENTVGDGPFYSIGKGTSIVRKKKIEKKTRNLVRRRGSFKEAREPENQGEAVQPQTARSGVEIVLSVIECRVFRVLKQWPRRLRMREPIAQIIRI